jgi:predicted transcriptional regulator
MSDVTVTVRMPKSLRDRLEALSAETQRSKSFLGMEAIAQFVETEEELVLGIKEAQAELRAGLGISHEEIVAQSQQHLESVFRPKN